MYKTSLLNNYLRDLINDFTAYTALNGGVLVPASDEDF